MTTFVSTRHHLAVEAPTPEEAAAQINAYLRVEDKQGDAMPEDFQHLSIINQRELAPKGMAVDRTNPDGVTKV